MAQGGRRICEPVQFKLDGGRLYMDGPPLAGREAPAITVVAAGDWASCRCYADAAERSPEALYDGLAADIRDADIAVVNFECSLAGKEPVTKEGPNLMGTTASAQAIKAAGFDAACLGNNHAADYGDEGLRESLRVFREVGLPVTGAGVNVEDAFRPVILERQGVRVGLLSVADPEDHVASPHGGGIASAMDLHVLDHVRALKTQCDVVILFVHGGREYVPVPSLYWYDQVLELAEAGADVVIGHHPHVPQGGTVLEAADGRRVPILFSTGNFVFRPALPKAYEIPPHTGDGYMVRVRLAGSRVSSVELVPYGIDGGDGVKRLTGAKLDDFARLIAALSEDLHDRRRVCDWFDAVVDFQWSRHYRARYEMFTRRMFEGDTGVLRFTRTHHRSYAHRTLIDRALERQQQGTFGKADPELTRRLEAWYAGTWPCGALGRPVAD